MVTISVRGEKNVGAVSVGCFRFKTSNLLPAACMWFLMGVEHGKVANPVPVRGIVF